MPDAKETIAAIKSNLAHMERYPEWTVGLTNDPEKTQVELDYPAFFRVWETDSASEARQVKTHCLELGMQEGNDYSREPRHVYLY